MKINKGPRKIFYVCAALNNNEIVLETIQASSKDEAQKVFFEKFSIYPKEINGPFFKKKIKLSDNNTSIQFTNQIKKAIYKDYIVNAFMLKIPDNHAFLVFIKNAQDNNSILPKGTITVPISELRFI